MARGYLLIKILQNFTNFFKRQLGVESRVTWPYSMHPFNFLCWPLLEVKELKEKIWHLRIKTRSACLVDCSLVVLMTHSLLLSWLFCRVMSLRIMIHCIVTYTLPETSATPIADNDREILRDQSFFMYRVGREKYIGKIKISVRHPLQTM